MASLVAKYRLNVRGETSAIGGDLVDGGALEALPFAQFDGRVDQRGAGSLLLAFTQAERWLPPDFSHDPGC